MLLHESEEVQVSGDHYRRMGVFEERRGSPHYIPYMWQQLLQSQFSSLWDSPLRDLHPNAAAAAATDCWGSAQGVRCCTAHVGKNKHCSCGSTVFVTGSFSQHGEMQYYYFCGIQTTDTCELWKKLILSQAKPVHPTMWGVKHGPHLKTGEANKSPE